MENDGHTCSKCGGKMDHTITNWYSRAAYANWCLKCIRRNRAWEGVGNIVSVVAGIVVFLLFCAAVIRFVKFVWEW